MLNDEEKKEQTTEEGEGETRMPLCLMLWPFYFKHKINCKITEKNKTHLW